MKTPSKNVRRSVSEIRVLLKKYDIQRGSVTDFCKLHKIHKANFYHWRKRFDLFPGDKAEFIPVEFKAAVSEPSLFAEIDLGSKYMVRLFQKVDAPYLKALLK